MPPANDAEEKVPPAWDDDNSEEAIEKRKARIKKAFDMFDKEKKGCVIQEEISTIMRYLGQYPSEKAMVEHILPDIQEEEPTAFVHYPKFEQKMLEIMATHEYDPDDEDVLMSAASIVALGYVGWIVHSQLRELRHLASVSAGAAPPVSTTSPSNARPPPQVQFATTVIRD